MKIDPINPNDFKEYSNSFERPRTSYERFLDKIKPRSAAMRTTILVSFVVLFSLFMSLWFFWRSLYLPEIQQHARYLVVELELIQTPNLHIYQGDEEVNIQTWLKNKIGVEYITNPKEYPNVREKPLADFFTRQVEKELARELHAEHVTVFFQSNPTPRIWVQTPEMNGHWLREPLDTYANYSPELIFAWFLGVPFITSIIILILVRQINRPLKRLQNAATNYTKTGKAPYLVTNHGPLEIRQVNQAFNHMVYTLEQAERDRLIMLAGISHDLRTPLTRIRLTAEMLPDEFLREGLVYDVDDMDAILSQFISYMRDGSDEEITPTNLNFLLQELVVQFKPLNIQFTPHPVPIIPARSLTLKRLIGNLINNAKRYGAEPIELSAQVVDKDIVIRVRDHGEGVPDEQIAELVQPFVRGEAARTIQGSGLGLAIVKRIVDLHQGSLILQNAEHGGFEVIIHLPIPE